MDRNTVYKDGELFPVRVTAGAIIHAGHMQAVNAQGFGVMASAVTGLTVIGVAWESVDNSTGTDGDITALTRRAKAFNLANSAADPVTQSSIGKPCYVADSVTVAATDNGGARPVAGIVHFINADGVWVLI